MYSYRAVESKRHHQQRDTGMEVVDDVCESEGLCEVMCDALSGQPQHESMETHVSEEEPAHLANSAPSLEDAQLPGAAHSDVNAQKPRFSYRLVLSQLGYNQNYYLFNFFAPPIVALIVF